MPSGIPVATVAINGAANAAILAIQMLALSDKELADKLFVEGRCGGMLSADIAGGEEGASILIKECPTIKLVPSLAGFSTTISYPAKTSHRAYSPEDMEAAGISMGQLRFSIGIEDADDIIAELAEALDKIEL